MIDRLYEIRFDPDGKGYAQISLGEGNPYLVNEVEVAGVVRIDQDKAVLFREVEVDGAKAKTLHPVKIAGEQALEWLSSKGLPFAKELFPSFPWYQTRENMPSREESSKLNEEIRRSAVLDIKSYGNPRLLSRD